MDPSGAPRRSRRAPPTNAGTRRTTGAATSTTQGRQPTHWARTPEMDTSGMEEPTSSDAVPPLNFQNRLLRPPRMGRTPRLSMPEISDESESEAETSYLAQPRQQNLFAAQRRGAPDQVEGQRHQAAMSEPDWPEPPEAQDTTAEEVADDVTEVEDERIEEDEDGHEEHEEDEESIYEHYDHDDSFSPLDDPAAMGLKEISNLGKFMVSSHKQGNGVDELRSDDTRQFWQSDGPQPHRLTIYFVKRVGIRAIRFYVNHADDESYTPTKIVFKSGTSENNLIAFATMDLKEPTGWQDVPIEGAGGDPDGNTLVSYVLQMQILENHQNGKDTHLRGIKIYAFDTDAPHGMAAVAAAAAAAEGTTAAGKQHGEKEEAEEEESSPEAEAQMSALAQELARLESGAEGLTIPDYMREAELR